MKFGAQLEANIYEPWRDKYVRYEELKDLLQKIFKKKKKKKNKHSASQDVVEEAPLLAVDATAQAALFSEYREQAKLSRVLTPRPSPLKNNVNRDQHVHETPVTSKDKTEEEKTKKKSDKSKEAAVPTTSTTTDGGAGAGAGAGGVGYGSTLSTPSLHLEAPQQSTHARASKIQTKSGEHRRESVTFSEYAASVGDGSEATTHGGGFDDGAYSNDDPPIDEEMSIEDFYRHELRAELRKVERHYHRMERKLVRVFDTLNLEAEGSHGVVSVDGVSSHLHPGDAGELTKTIDKYLLIDTTSEYKELVENSYFFRSKVIPQDLIPKLYTNFAAFFEGGDIARAKTTLMGKMTKSEYGSRELFQLGVKVGMVIVFLLWNIVYMSQQGDIIHFGENQAQSGTQSESPASTPKTQTHPSWVTGFDVVSQSSFGVSNLVGSELATKTDVGHHHRHGPASTDIRTSAIGFYPLYRGIGLFILLIWGWGTNIYVWTKYRISYVFLFEFNPHNRLTHWHIWEEAADLTIVYLVNLLLFLTHHDYHLANTVSQLVYPLSLILWVMCKLLMPFAPFSHWKTRKCLFTALKNLVIAPFGRARFQECYLGDILTSMVKPIVDLEYSVCIYGSGVFLDLTSGNNVCTKANWIVVPIVVALPFFWRFNQNMRRFYETRQRFPHLGNAFKYFLAHTVIIASSFHPDLLQWSSDWTWYRWMWLGVCVLSTLVTYTWDVRMDWGLGRPHNKSGYPFLRDVLMYHRPSFYYWVMVSNLFLRLLWVINVVPFPFNNVLGAVVANKNLWLPILVILEIFRRIQWGMLRVEYEHINNDWGFRSSDYVPIFFDTDRERHERKAHTDEGYGVIVEVALMIFILVVIAVVGAVFGK